MRNHGERHIGVLREQRAQELQLRVVVPALHWRVCMEIRVKPSNWHRSSTCTMSW